MPDEQKLDVIERATVDEGAKCLLIEARGSNGSRKILRLPLAASLHLFQLGAAGMKAYGGVQNGTSQVRPDRIVMSVSENDETEFLFEFGGTEVRFVLPRTALADIRDSLAHATGAKPMESPPGSKQH